MHNAIKLTALSAAIVLGGWSVADARSGKGAPISFEALDTDGDGQVTRAEVEARGDARFAEVDSDGNGTLSRDELLARARADNERRVDRMLQKLDTDEDGSLSQAELSSGRRGGGTDKFFDRMDADGDGAITKEEFETAQAEFRERRSKRKSSDN